jgi:predicted TIM-barrel fold metal-dependent hydrolase
MLLDLMGRNDIDRTVLVQVIHYRWDNSFVADTLRRYPDRFMGVCRVNPEDPAAPDHLSRLTEEEGFHGVRLSPAADGADDWFTGPLMDPIFARASELAVPMLILTGTPRLPDLRRLVDRHPDLDLVIDHMADCHPEDAEGLAALLDLARFPRVFVKISHTWGLSRVGYPWADTHEMVQAVVDAFGPDRCMWGTDWPVCLARTTYEKTLSVVRNEMSFLSPDDLEWVTGGTAHRLWRFD